MKSTCTPKTSWINTLFDLQQRLRLCTLPHPIHFSLELSSLARRRNGISCGERDRSVATGICRSLISISRLGIQRNREGCYVGHAYLDSVWIGYFVLLEELSITTALPTCASLNSAEAARLNTTTFNLNE